MPGHPLADLPIGCHGTHATFGNDLKRPLWAIANRVREHRVRAGERTGSLSLVHGPPTVETGPDELLVLTLVRDAELWVQSFVEHHLALGAKHIILLDNGSEDDTIARASRYDRVSVYRTSIPFRQYELGMRRWLTQTFGRGRWTLAPDADELWDYPHSDQLSLRDFLGYLNHHGYQAVTAHALDMFSDLPFSQLRSSPDDDLREQYRWYDLADIITTREEYWIRNGQTESEDIFCTFGGIRQRLFGTGCLCQTRHALHFTGNGSDPYRYDGHFTAGARIADVSTVLLHYKYVSRLYDQAVANLAEGNHHRGSENYRGFVQVLSENPDFSMRTPTARELHAVDELVDGGLLTVSDAYLRWVEEHPHGAVKRGGVRTPVGAGAFTAGTHAAPARDVTVTA